MRAVYIAVCDDQIEELEKLTGLLEAWRTDRKANVRYQTFRSAAELLDAAQREGFTLYLLDVLMPGMSGMEAAREIRAFDAADGAVHEVSASMKEYEGTLLARPEFMRVHRSYIVNMLQAETLSPTGLTTFSGQTVPVSRLLYGQLQRDYLALLFSGREL